MLGGFPEGVAVMISVPGRITLRADFAAFSVIETVLLGFTRRIRIPASQLAAKIQRLDPLVSQ